MNNMAFDFPETSVQVDQRDLIIDCFCGGGGASLGIKRATGRSPDYAINHDGAALAMHLANHPETEHINSNINKIDPMVIIGRRRVGLLWSSPDCKHFSKAKGSKPVKREIRDLAWNFILWGKRARPKVMFLENVEEFLDWGPLIKRKGRWFPDPDRKGETFRLWLRELRRIGYRVEWRLRRACDFSDPTIRRRLILIARCDGQPIVWPMATHAAPKSPAVIKGLLPAYRTAAECIDWSLPCPSIFETREEIREKHGLIVKRPLVDNTLKRIATGVYRYVINAQTPFIVTCNHGGDWFRGQDINDPFLTLTASRDAHGLVTPYLLPRYQEKEGHDPRLHSVDEPVKTIIAGGNVPGSLITPILSAAQHGGTTRDVRTPHHTITASSKDQNQLITPTLMQANHIQRDFGKSIGHDVNEPISTITAGGGGHAALVATFMAQHNTGMVGHSPDKPLSTITQRGTQQAVISTHMMSLKGTDRRDSAMTEPAPTICAGGTHAAMVSAFMVKYYGTGENASALDTPMHSITSRDRFALVMVTINGIDYVIVDIGMRMLTPRELFRCQGFPESYNITPKYRGKTITKQVQVSCCGNSVPPGLVAAHVAANSNWLIEPKRKAA